MKMPTRDCKANGRKLVDGHDASTDTDRIAIGTACIWLSDTKSAQFLALEAAKYYIAGRCRETSLAEVKDICIKDFTEERNSYRVLAFKVKDRDKQGGHQTLPLFPHQECMQQDVYFALMYNVLVRGFVETYLFDDFAARAHKNIRGQTTSTTSQLWSSNFKSIIKNSSRLQRRLTST